MVVDAVGAGLGIAGLLAAFDGAVRGYLLIESMFDKDNGLQDLALSYNIECQKLKAWGDRFNVNAEREEDCLLYHEPPSIKLLMANIFGRIQKLQDQAEGFLECHQASDSLVHPSDIQTQPSTFNSLLQLGSAAVKDLSRAQKAKKHKKRGKWAIKNKDKFANVVAQLRNYNEDLTALLSGPSFDTFQKALPSYVLASVNSHKHLKQTCNIQGSSNSLIRQTAQLKFLQSSADEDHDPIVLKYEDLSPVEGVSDLQIGATRPRSVSIYANESRVWVDWLEIESTLSPVETDRTRERIRTLSVMLKSAPESFRVAECIGCLEHENNALRLGLAYRIPATYGRATPVSLLQIIESYKRLKEPPLGDKFKLAQTLAITIMQLHASNWLHKAFRSDNILFFSGLHSHITDPYLAGFEYSRDTKMQSIGYRPIGEKGLDYYYHPDVVNGYTKTLDLYSLGVVLLEIAFWRPLVSKIPKHEAKSLESIRDLFVKTAEDKLDAVVGKIYADVVRTCLICDFPNPASGAEFACAMNSEIVLQLEQCRA